MKGKLKKIFISVGKVFMIALLAAFLIFAACYCFLDEKQTETIRTKAETNIPVSSTHKLTQWDTIDYENNKIVIQSFTKIFDGTETWEGGANSGIYKYHTSIPNNLTDGPCVANLSGINTITAVDGNYYIGGNFNVWTSSIDTIDEWKAYLAAQYAAGDPVKVSYKTAESYSVGLDYFYNAGKADGYQEGHDNGYTEGYDACWDIAYAQGYADGKKDGYDVGYEEGFAAGYNDGYGKAVDVLATGLLTKGNASYINKQLAPSGSGVSCNAYSDYFTYSYAESYRGLLYLNCARSYSNGYKLKIKVNEVTVETVFSAMLLDLETNSSAMYEVFRLPVVSTATTYEVTVSLPVSTTRSFKSFVITPASVPSGGTIKGLEIEVVGSEKDYYDNGYDNGYAEGQKFGYDSGYTKGYAMGKSDAMSQMSDSDLPSSVRSFVFSLFDAPVTSFLSAFNLSYDGFDLGALVSFIFTAIVIVGVIRVVT